MKRFSEYEKLLNNINITFSSEIKYANEELKGFLETSGSDIVENIDDEPKCTFELNLNDKTYKIGVTSYCIDKEYGNYKYYYWLDKPIIEEFNCIHCNKKDDTVIDYEVENYDREKLKIKVCQSCITELENIDTIICDVCGKEIAADPYTFLVEDQLAHYCYWCETWTY